MELYEAICDILVKEIGHENLRKQFNPRTSFINQFLVGSGLVGFTHNDIIYTDISILSDKELSLKNGIDFKSGSFSIRRAKIGCRDVMLKTLLSKRPKDCYVLLGYELKTFLHIGFHQNIVAPIGLTKINDNIYSVYQFVDMSITLNNHVDLLSCFSNHHIIWFARPLISALDFIHERGIILNNLTGNTVVMKMVDGHREPMIVDMSLSCHVKGAKPLALSTVEKVSRWKSLPQNVLCRKLAPSISSDNYSLSVLLWSFSNHLYDDDDERAVLSRFTKYIMDIKITSILEILKEMKCFILNLF